MTLDLKDFLDLTPKVQETKIRIDTLDDKNLKLLCIKGYNQQSEKATYGMRENIYESCI